MRKLRVVQTVRQVSLSRRTGKSALLASKLIRNNRTSVWLSPLASLCLNGRRETPADASAAYKGPLKGRFKGPFKGRIRPSEGSDGRNAEL